MAESPVLETPRLRVVSFREEFLTPRYVAWLNDRKVVRYSEQRFRTHTLESCRAYWQSFNNTPNYFWAIVARDPMLRHIGNINAFVTEFHRVADIGIVIGEEKVWGKGYGTEAWRAVCEFLLNEDGIRKVTAGTLAVNEGMLRIMRKIGMAEEGRRVRQCLFEGQEVDVVYAALFKENWK